jgi:K+-sensing histidine kinase KdpD
MPTHAALAEMLTRVKRPRQASLRLKESHTDLPYELGLYICKCIAQAHDGTVGVASDEKGTVLTARIPRFPHPQIEPGRKGR